MTKQVDPLSFPEWTDREISALQMLYEGQADPGQQRLVLHAIINKLSRPHDLLWVEGKPDATGVLNGRAFVGAKLLKYLKMPIGKLKEAESNHG